MSANFEYYKAFYYVARCLSFTQAASILHSSQPAITRAIHNLIDIRIGLSAVLPFQTQCFTNTGR